MGRTCSIVVLFDFREFAIPSLVLVLRVLRKRYLYPNCVMAKHISHDHLSGKVCQKTMGSKQFMLLKSSGSSRYHDTSWDKSHLYVSRKRWVCHSEKKGLKPDRLWYCRRDWSEKPHAWNCDRLASYCDQKLDNCCPHRSYFDFIARSMAEFKGQLG